MKGEIILSKNVFVQAIENTSSYLEMYSKEIALLSEVAPKFSDIEEMEDVSSVTVSKYGNTVSVNFYLKEDKRDSKLIHKLAQKFGVKFEKTPSWDKRSLVARGDSKDGNFSFTVAGYVPATCALVTEEIELTQEEIEEARKNVPTKKTVTKVVCA